MRTTAMLFRDCRTIGADRAFPYVLATEDPSAEEPAGDSDFNYTPAGREDLPYKVELWDEAKASVEQVLAVTANGSIGYAAYYAATREYPNRYITLRHKSGIVSRWNGPDQ